jgi:S1-C subfamily serine protease
MIRLIWFGLAIFLSIPTVQAAPGDRIRPGQSVVRIEATGQLPNYVMPWAPGRMTGGVGSGFVIADNRILTNAHVVSHARFITVSKQGDPKPYTATVEHIAHDADLAMLRVYDETFFEGMSPLAIGGIPALESTVSAFGYPIGGDRISVTRGVVSRIDFQPYAHTGADSHLTIQIDAAINPGNSGGPVLQDGKVVGVAFQGFSGDVAQNVGYMIPTPVINRFLQDVENGNYDRYVDLALTYSPLFNPAARQALGLEEPDRGVLVGTVFGGGSADGFIEQGDVLLSIEGFPIASDGTVELENENIELAEIVERKFLDDTIRVELLRNRELLEVEIPLKPFPFLLMGNSYRDEPPFVTFGGLVFQPVDRDLIDAFNPGDFRLRFLFNTFLVDHIYRERPELIVLSSILADEINSHANEFRFQILDTINGETVRNLADVARLLAEPAEFYVFRFLGDGRPLVLEASEVEKATDRINDRYRVTKTKHLQP